MSKHDKNAQKPVKTTETPMKEVDEKKKLTKDEYGLQQGHHN